MPRLPNSKAQQAAHAFIRQKILDGDYTGGSWLKPQDIAKELNVSRMPVREALRGLEMEGLVTMRPNRGAIVTELSMADVDDLFEMRANLEVLAAISALEARTSEAMKEIERLREAMDSARTDTRAWVASHNAFHDYISAISGRKRLVMEIERARALIQPYIRLYIDVYGTPELPAYEHSELVRIFQVGDAGAVAAAFRSHIMEARDRVLKFLKQHNDYRTGMLRRQRK
ncbi:GntR family transcriptional regulator [Ferrovibrio sp.]|uniref:GntR family transcriptional regulator n=1 Tax=Ferrovibrio sp. TaxID=1917215 RepID=UPI000CC16F4D|nr:GntR family transcriptional regulator [Ferrovibrio sp.]PJI44546.1 MAG: GntR family transcriptional regulator [Ferrovibrio sp.]